MVRLKTLVQNVFTRLGLVLLTSKSFSDLQDKARLARRYQLLEAFPVSDHLRRFFELANQSHSQLDQDLLAVLTSGFKERGFFVEFGATNGRDLSNSLLLESRLNWTGILAEPGLVWRDALAANRTVSISNKAVWSASGVELEFVEDGELSTISKFKSSDQHVRKGRTYKVTTITLLDLLKEFGAPTHIDFLSVDTEGSELDVLSSFDFSQYSFGLICVEHNYTANRKKIQDLLAAHGYQQILPDVSQWDDWFVPEKKKTI
jgi:FkbM family methyltransferase